MALVRKEIPEEIRNLIISRLSYPDIIRLYSTTTLYYDIIGDDKLWELLLDRDFPGIKDYFSQFPFTEQNNYHRYKQLFDIIDEQTREAMKKYDFIDSRCIKEEVIYNDVFTIFYDILLQGYKGELDDAEISRWADKLLTRLTGLKKKYVGYYDKGQLDFVRLRELDLAANEDIREFLDLFDIIIPEA